MQPGVAVRDYLKQTAFAFPKAEGRDLSVKLFFGLFSAGCFPPSVFLPGFVCVDVPLTHLKTLLIFVICILK